MSCAQRRPEPKPRRHQGSLKRSWPWSIPLNEGRSRNPGDTRPWRCACARLVHAQRRPEPKPRRHTNTGIGSIANGPPLNEGRSRNPGDTRGHEMEPQARALAQRRPEPKPRRHGRDCDSRLCARSGSLNEGRSRNPGDTANCPIKRRKRENWHARTRFPGLTSAHARPRAPQRVLSRA